MAFQRQQLLDMRELFYELDLDLDRLLLQEQRTAEGISELRGEAEQLKDALGRMGVDTGPSRQAHGPAPTAEPAPEPPPRYRRLEVISPERFEELSARAGEYLERAGIDLDKDPLPQILTGSEIEAADREYRKRYGDISWGKTDYLVVLTAGVAAALVDIFLVDLPLPVYLNAGEGRAMPLIYDIKDRLRGYTEAIHEKYLKKLERRAKVTYDARYPSDVDGLVAGLRPAVHRLMGLGHDPGLLIIGVLDLMSGKGTYIDRFGKIISVPAKGFQPLGFIDAFNRVFLHLLSDMFSSAGVPPPFFSLLQLIPGMSPFALKEGGPRVSWTDLARFMYRHGYDLRHFSLMGLVPATVKAVIQAYWLYYSFGNKEQAEKEHLKLASMMLMGHMLATAGNALKVGLVSASFYSFFAPMAVNWAELLKLAPVVLTYFAENAKRDRRIRAGLDAEWLSIYRSISAVESEA